MNSFKRLLAKFKGEYISPTGKTTPQTFEEAIHSSITLIPEEMKENIKKLPKKIVNDEDRDAFESNNYNIPNFWSGMAIRNDFGLWDENSPLYKEFWNRWKIWHADDSSAIIMETIIREIRGEPWLIDEQVTFYHNYWKFTSNVEPGSKPSR